MARKAKRVAVERGLYRAGMCGGPAPPRRASAMRGGSDLVTSASKKRDARAMSSPTS